MYDIPVTPTTSALTKLASRAALLSLLATSAAQTPRPAYNPLETFASLTLPSPPNAYRDSSGAPGPLYWQNRADYELHATITQITHVLRATEVITYTNNSPDSLDCLWLNLEQNIYRKDARSSAFSGGSRRRPENTSTPGFLLESVELQSLKSAATSKPVTVVSDTRLQIQLAKPLASKSKIKILIHYQYIIPGLFGGRTSWVAAQQGEIYDIAQWYPRMCVYDDLRGWDTQPYLGNEFYLEYGDFDYTVTVPSNFLVAGSGELTNAAAVLTREELARFAKAKTSDKTVLIRTADEALVASAERPTTTKTWHFHMNSTRDVSFSASPTFLWDAAKMNIVHDIDAGKPHTTGVQLAQSVYPVESAGDAAWGRSTEYLKDAVEHFSRRWYPYPWPNAINVAGGSSGMEYPGILFDGIKDKGAELFWITAHEIGHSWFPMIVGSNERRDAWIDEGFNTFIDTFESDEFSNGIYGPKRDGEYAPNPDLAPADQIAVVMADPHAPAILTRADAIGEKYRHSVTYFKSAFGLTLLRENILGPQRFDPAFRKFIASWAYKHPAPSDFFRTMESEGGEDLSYYWRGWYLNTWQLDMAITLAEPVNKSDATKGVRVAVANLSQLVLPTTLRIELEDESHIDVAVPAETWLQNTTHVFTVPTGGKRAISVTLDPGHTIPDADRSNNTLKF